MNRRAGLLRGLIRFAFRDRIISVRGETGARLWFRPAEYPGLLRGVHRLEPEIRCEWSQILIEGERIFDIGANIGITAQRFVALLGGKCRVWAFEPAPRNLSLLERNAQELGSAVSVVASAVGNRDGTTPFSDNLQHGALSRLAALDRRRQDAAFWRASRDIDVPIVRLDSFVAANPDAWPSFIKLDVEGAAHWALEGARGVLANHRPAVSCSFHNTQEEDGVKAVLAAADYKGLVLNSDRSRLADVRESRGAFVHPADARIPLILAGGGPSVHQN